MKKIIGLLALALFLNGCDDGDLTVETINFDDVQAVQCNINANLIYKLNGNEILALEVDPDENPFINEPTAPGTTRDITLNGTNKVVYRSYNGTVSTANICATIPASSPNVTEEWTATSGTVQVITTQVDVTNPTTNATTITHYNHYIVFKNISFVKPSGTQIYETFVFGNYRTQATSLPLVFDADAVQKCPTTNEIYNFNGSSSFVLNLDASLYPNTVGTQTTLVNAANKATYKLFTGALSQSYFCQSPAPATPVLSEEWNAVDGVVNVSGIIEVVTTTETASSWRHYIHLKNVVMKKGNSTFTLGDDYLYGSFVTSN